MYSIGIILRELNKTVQCVEISSMINDHMLNAIEDDRLNSLDLMELQLFQEDGNS